MIAPNYSKIGFEILEDLAALGFTKKAYVTNEAEHETKIVATTDVFTTVVSVIHSENMPCKFRVTKAVVDGVEYDLMHTEVLSDAYSQIRRKGGRLPGLQELVLQSHVDDEKLELRIQRETPLRGTAQ